MYIAGEGRGDVVLKLSRVSVSYGQRNILQAVDLDIQAGECLLVTGDNGSGKSTLLRVIAGVRRPSAGERQTSLGRDDIRMMPQYPRLAWTLSVRDNVALSLRNWDDLSWTRTILRGRALRVRWEQLQIAASDVVRRFGLAAQADRRAAELSGGERKLLSAAIAMSAGSPLVLLDEPFAGLSEAAIERVSAAIADAKAAGRSVVIVEHRTKRAALLADRVVGLSEGQVVGNVEVEAATNVFSALRLVDAQPKTTVSAPSRDVVLACLNLSGGWRGDPVIEAATIKVSRGEIVGIIGENGSGKSTLVALLSGILTPSQGTVILRHIDATAMGAHRRFALGMRVLLQTRRLFGKLSVAENFRLAGITRIPQDCLPPDVDEWRLAGTLSGGEQTIVGLTLAALDESFCILLLDEPTAGLDARARARAGGMLDELRQLGKAVLVVEHDRGFLADRGSRNLALVGRRISDSDNV